MFRTWLLAILVLWVVAAGGVVVGSEGARMEASTALGSAVDALTPWTSPSISQGEMVGGESTFGQSQTPVDADYDHRILYSRTKLALGVVADVWSWAVLLGFLALGLSANLRDFTCRTVNSRRGALLLFFALFGLSTWLLAVPLDFYDSFVVEHQFGLSNQGLGDWSLDQLKGLALDAAVGLPMAVGLYWVINRAPRWWWLGVAGFSILLSVVFAALFPVLLSPLYNSYQPVENRALVERIEGLAAGQGVAVSEVLQEDTSQRTTKANAYFAGLGATRRIVLTDNLLTQFTEDEIVVVIAHELGHQVHNDIWRAIAFGSLFYLGGFYVVYRLLHPILRRFGDRFGFSRVGDVASLPLLLLLFGVLSFAAMPVVNGYSRWVEHGADQYALELTGDTHSFISAMEKLGAINLSDPNPPRILEVLFYTHPPIQDRVDYARQFEAARSTSS